MKITRDNNSGALINLDEDEYNAAKLRKQSNRKKQQQEFDINYLKRTISDLLERVKRLENIINK